MSKLKENRQLSITLLAIETSTENCSVALSVNGQIFHEQKIAPQQHSHLIFPMLEKLLGSAGLSQHQIDLVAFGRGPGSFTGVRLATSIAQSIAFASDIPVVPVSTLRALAQQAWRIYQNTHVISALDARLTQIFYGCFTVRDKHMEHCGNEILCHPQPLQREPNSSDTNWTGIGSGWDRYFEKLKGKWIKTAYPQACDIASLALQDYAKGYSVSPLEVKPVYIRNQVAHPPSKNNVKK